MQLRIIFNNYVYFLANKRTIEKIQSIYSGDIDNAYEIAEKLGAEPVQAIGSKFVLYKQAKNPKNRKIEF